MKFDKEYVVDKFIENNLKNLTQSNLADLMSISVKVSKDLKRATLLKKHLPSLATQLKKLNIWGFRDASAVIYGLQYMNEVEVCNIKDYKMPDLKETNPANDYGAYKGSANNHHNVIENVANTINGKNKITTNAMEGLKVVDIIERIYALRPKSVIKNITKQ